MNVTDIGIGGTEEVYFATSHLNADGGIMITASHNPGKFNGVKIKTAQGGGASTDITDKVEDYLYKTPVKKVDEHENNGRGPITEKLQSAFFEIITNGTKEEWLYFI